MPKRVRMREDGRILGKRVRAETPARPRPPATPPGGRLARINGKLYRQGDPITLQKDGQQIVFSLAEIHPRHVVLDREEERFELKIPASQHVGRMEVFVDGN